MVEEMSYILCGAKFFSELDARSGYWAVELDYAASLLTTSTPTKSCTVSNASLSA